MALNLSEVRGEHALGALLWFVVIVPPAFGFWLVAGDLAGVAPGDYGALLAASMLTIGAATLAQVVGGYKLPIYEGPAGNYLAAVAVLAISNPTPAEATGGLLVGGALVLALGALGADRMLGALFTPPVVVTFLLVVVILATPPTVERAIEASAAQPLGTPEAWASAVVVIAIATLMHSRAGSRAYGLLVALGAGLATFFALAGLPDVELRSSAVAIPALFPWGAPELSLSIVAPFAVAAVLASFNTVASIRVMSEATNRTADASAERRGLLVHGGAQGLGACVGNVLGHVPRIDATGAAKLIGSADRLSLGLAAAAIVALAFVGPFIDLLSYIPVSVSAALLAVVLGVIVWQGFGMAARMEPRVRWLVIAPAVAPAVVWLLAAGDLSETAQLVTNPLLIGVVLAVLLDRMVRAREPAELRPRDMSATTKGG